MASSDATNMELTAVVDGDEVIINGRKWWTTGIGHPDCAVMIVMGLTDPDANKYAQHSMVLVPVDTDGVVVERMLDTMGFFDEPFGHGEVSFTDVRVPVTNIIAGPGRAFEIAQGRLGPGRVHHAMRMVGMAERALHLACERGLSRIAFGKPIINLGGKPRTRGGGTDRHRCDTAAHPGCGVKLDTVGPLGALSEVSAIKVAAPNMAQTGHRLCHADPRRTGLSSDFPLSGAWTTARPCAWPTVPTKCTKTSSPGSNSANMARADDRSRRTAAAVDDRICCGPSNSDQRADRD